MAINVSDILSSLAIPFFSGTTLRVFLSKSMVLHFSFDASPDRIPVSLSSLRKVDVMDPHAAIS